MRFERYIRAGSRPASLMLPDIAAQNAEYEAQFRAYRVATSRNCQPEWTEGQNPTDWSLR